MGFGRANTALPGAESAFDVGGARPAMARSRGAFATMPVAEWKGDLA